MLVFERELIKMELFIISFFVLLLFTPLLEDKSDSKQLLFYIAAFIVVMALFAFCDKSAFPDLMQYEGLFYNSRRVSWSNIADLQHYNITDKFEIGWCAYTKLMSSIFSDSKALLYCTYAIITFCYLSFIKRYSKNPWFSVVLFILLVVYNSIFVLRQNLVMAICLNLYPLIEKKKAIWFFPIIIALYFIHKTALIFAIMYFMKDFKFNIKYMALLFLASFAFIYFFRSILIYLAELSDWYKTLNAYTITEEASNYMTAVMDLFVFVYIAFVTKLKKLSQIDSLLITAFIICIIIDLARIGTGGTLGRLATYFSVSLCVLLPNACTKIKDTGIRIVSIICIIILYCLASSGTMSYGYTW